SQHADEHALAVPDNRDGVAKVTLNQKGLGSLEPTEPPDGDRRGREGEERLAPRRLLAKAIHDLRPEELRLLEQSLVDRLARSLWGRGQQLTHLAPGPDLAAL